MAEPIEAVNELPAEQVAPPTQAEREAEPWFEPDEYVEPKGAGEAEAAPVAKEAAKPAEKAPKPAPKVDKPKDLTAQDWVRIRKMEREAKSMRAEAEQLKANAERIERDRADDAALKERDPYAWAQKHKLDFRKVVEHVARDGDEDPKDVAIRELKARLEQVEGVVKQTREQAEKQQQELTQAEEVQRELAYVESEVVEAGIDAYPHLHAVGKELVAQIARARYYAYDSQGQPKDLDEVFGELEEEYRELAGKLASLRKSDTPSGSQSKRLGPPSRENGAVRSVKHEKRSEPALTERTISQRASADRELSDDELAEQLAARL